MSKNIRKILLIFVVFSMSLTIISCDTDDVKDGKEDVVADIDWSSYDNIIDEIKNLGKCKERDLLLHKAEEMLMDQACVIPIDTICSKALCRDNLKDIRIDHGNILHLEELYFEDGKKTANIQLFNEPNTLDPGLAMYNSEHTYLYNTYGTLISYDKDDNIKNVFLDYSKTSDDGLIWDITLKKGLKWSDGKPLTAKDFVYTFKRNAKSETGGPLSFVFNMIEGYPDNLNVKQIDDLTFEVKLKSICPYFLTFFTSNPYMPIREDIVEKSKDWYLTLPSVTAGPYVLKEWKHKESLVLEKNPYYFDADNIKVDRINLMLNENATSVYNAYLAGDIDFALTIPSEIEREDIIIFETKGMNYLRINVKSKMFEGFTADEAKKLRQAIACCIDREFIEDMSHGLSKESYTFVNEFFNDSEGESFLRNTDNYTYPYEKGYFEKINLDKARKLLKEIGYHFDEKGRVKEDITFEIMAKIAGYDKMSIIQSDLAKVGINAKIRKRDDAFANSGNYYSMNVGWFPDYNDPLAMLELFTTTNDNNTCFIGRDFPKKN